MECEKCEDRGFTEENHGLIRIFCDCEKGKQIKAEITGKPPDVAEIEDINTGLLFQLAGKRTDEYSDDELWMMAKKEAEVKTEWEWPHIVRMPCGNTQRFDDFVNLPVEDIPCPCGNPNHYIVRFDDRREASEVAVTKVTKPKKGQYFCAKCKRLHRLASRVGKRHFKTSEARI